MFWLAFPLWLSCMGCLLYGYLSDKPWWWITGFLLVLPTLVAIWYPGVATKVVCP